MINFNFFMRNAMLGVGLAMDAFSASLANGLYEPTMRKKKTCAVAGVFAVFQGVMPLIGWFCVHTVLQYFQAFEKCIPWIALLLLGFIGGKTLLEGLRGGEENPKSAIGFTSLLVQGVATSIDALSVGFTIASDALPLALLSATTISLITFFICWLGVELGKKFGTKLAGKANIFGGLVLIVIGLEIFLTGVLA